MDHDRLFKELLSTFFLEFLELSFPNWKSGCSPSPTSRSSARSCRWPTTARSVEEVWQQLD